MVEARGGRLEAKKVKMLKDRALRLEASRRMGEEGWRRQAAKLLGGQGFRTKARKRFFLVLTPYA